MSKLLSANFIRLKKDKFFWSGLVFMLAAGIFFPVMRYMDMRQTQTINRIDNGFFGCALFIGIVMAVFCSLFIGTEYSEGTIRNKIIIGQKRGTVLFVKFYYMLFGKRCYVYGIFLFRIFASGYLFSAFLKWT